MNLLRRLSKLDDLGLSLSGILARYFFLRSGRSFSQGRDYRWSGITRYVLFLFFLSLSIKLENL